ncbi:MAG: aspartate 1-decarboxylase, partial [Thermoguttaceae bacterium]|nr:aspartate 1-decarboxylase [Thermoguttaceae bacterium]
GTVMLNGPAARAGAVGDVLVIITYGLYADSDLTGYRAKVVKVDERNRVKG